MLNARIALAAAALAVGLVPAAQAATEWSLATGLPDHTYFAKNYKMLIDEVDKGSGGQLKIKYYGNSSLVKRDAIRRSIQSGQIQMGEVDFVNLGNEDAVFNLDSLPGIVANYDQAWALMEAQKPYVEKLFAERGLRIVGYSPWPGQGIYTKKPARGLDDFKGIKFRIYSEPTKRMAEMLGFTPVVLPAGEVPQAFASGMIEGMFTGASTGVISQAWDNTKSFMYVGAMHSKQSLVVSEEAFKKLGGDVQKVLIEAGQNLTKRAWEMSNTDNVGQMKILQDKGMMVSNAPTDVMSRMDEISKVLIADWKAKAPPGAAAVLDAYLAKAKK